MSCVARNEQVVEAPVTEQLVVRDRSRGAKHCVEERRGVPLGEDQPVVMWILGLIEVVSQVLREQDHHQLGRRYT